MDRASPIKVHFVHSGTPFLKRTAPKRGHGSLQARAQNKIAVKNKGFGKKCKEERIEEFRT